MIRLQEYKEGDIVLKDGELEKDFVSLNLDHWKLFVKVEL